ncbi:MAG: DUF1540 domain-containing protein [Clostridia bacterium]|nr:DUF1540 domain-containing protein [Clostridia bacterium]
MEKHNCNCISGIVCDATNCTYNDSKKCTASNITIGNCNATSSRETECNTFKTK